MSYEIEQMVNDLADGFGGKKAVRRRITAYEAAWARMQHDEPGAPRSAEDQTFEASLLPWLRYHHAMPVALRFMQQNPGLTIIPTYDAVLVDEYQDLNRADQTLVAELAGHGQLTVIGDDNQSIYSFRHAHPEGIRVFPADHPGTAGYVIEECRRCPPNIVAMSNALLANDPAARPMPLTPMPGRAPAHVVIVQHASVEEEAETVAAFIDRYLTNHPDLPPGQVLVLSPRRLMGNAVKDALIRRKRNALSYFWEDAVDSDAAAEGFCLLTLAVDGTDRAAYRAWLGIGHPKGHAPAYTRVRARAEADDVEPRIIVEQSAARTLTLPYAGGLVTRHQSLLARVAALETLDGLPLVEALWPPGNDDTQTIRLAAQNLAAQYPKPADLLRELREVVTQPELPDSDGEVIRVMSLHKSKGLTAALVVVVGCVSGAIPTVDDDLLPAARDAAWREQRRLFYVAITRATSTLVLSCITRMPLGTALRAGIRARQIVRDGWERVAVIAASPFLAELGPDAPRTVRGTDWRATEDF